MRIGKFIGATVLGWSLAMLAAVSQAQDVIKIGVLAATEGNFAAVGQDALRGVELALRERQWRAGGKRIEIVHAASDASAQSALAGARRLVEEERVSIMVGPLSGGEGVALMDFIRAHPQTTFLNGTSAAQEVTLVNPAPNFFRFSMDGAQWSTGLGVHAFAKGYRRVVVVAEDYAFPYAQVAGFMVEFCRAGGRVLDKHWVALGTKEYGDVIRKIPTDIDAVYVALGGADAANFLSQYEKRGDAKPLIGGTIAIDQSILSYKGRNRSLLVGTPSSGPVADTLFTSDWLTFVNDYRTYFKNGFPSPSMFAHGYYVNMKAALEGIDIARGDLSNSHAALRRALGSLVMKTPTGEVRLDKNRNAIANNYITEVTRIGDGSLINKVVKTIPAVQQNLGLSAAEFSRTGLGSRTNPECK